MEKAASSDVRLYRLRPEAEAEEQRRARSYVVPSIIFVITAGILASFWLSSRGQNSILIPGSLGALYIAWVAIRLPIKTRKRVAQCWQTYELRLGDDFIERSVYDVPTLRLAFSEVRRIDRTPGRYLRVYGPKPGNVISIPEAIESFPEVLARISALGAVETTRGELWQKQVAVMALGFAGYITMLWLPQPRAAFLLSIVMGFFLLWVFRYYRRSKNMSARTKRIAWLYLVFLVPCALKALVALGQMSHR